MRTRTFVAVRTRAFYRVGNCHDQGPLAQPGCVVCASECGTPRGKPQRTTGGSPPGGSCTGGGWFSGGSCSGTGGGSTGGNVGSSILGSGVSAGIGIVMVWPPLCFAPAVDNRVADLIPARWRHIRLNFSLAHRLGPKTAPLRESAAVSEFGSSKRASTGRKGKMLDDC
jgi:hypothetical protein